MGKEQFDFFENLDIDALVEQPTQRAGSWGEQGPGFGVESTSYGSPVGTVPSVDPPDLDVAMASLLAWSEYRAGSSDAYEATIFSYHHYQSDARGNRVLVGRFGDGAPSYAPSFAGQRVLGWLAVLIPIPPIVVTDSREEDVTPEFVEFETRLEWRRVPPLIPVRWHPPMSATSPDGR